MKHIVKEILDTKLRKYRGNCPLDLTDLVFLEIEKSYLGAYEDAVNYKGADTINKFIGKSIK